MLEPTTRSSDDPGCHDSGPATPAGAMPLGRRRFLQGVGAAAAAGALSGGWSSGGAHALAIGASQFVPLAQVVRALDTRKPTEHVFQRLAANHVRVALAGRLGVGDDATAIVATLTAVNPAGPNWVTIVPSSASVPTLLTQNRLVSVLNMTSVGQATANLAQVMLGPDGVDIVSRDACDMVLDVIGYYRPVTGPVREGRFVGLAAARRAVDTRQTIGFVGQPEPLVVELTAFVPADASSVVINLTATECRGPGYFTAYPYAPNATPPTASSLNVNSPDETRAAAVIVPIETTQAGQRFILVYASVAAKLIVDVTGYFTGSASALSEVGLFVPVDPVRILDTREPGQIGRLWQGWTVEGAVPGDGALGGSAVINLTGVDSRAPGFLTVAAARVPLPATSNLNFSGPLQVVPNHSITPITAGHGYQVFASGGAHVIVDYMGYYTGTPASATIAAPINPPPPPIGPEWLLEIPKIGLQSRVLEGNGTAITNAGHSWHWEGTGLLGQEAQVASFAHRTTHGGPYRNIHLLSSGDQFTLTTLDRRQFTYQVVRRDLTNGVVQNIIEATRLHPGTTYSLIACSRTDFTPTSTSWRIVVTGALIGWREL